MTPFTQLCSIAAPMPDADIDTDIIFPARFLVLTQKVGLGPYAFYEKRFDQQGRKLRDFILHRSQWRSAKILVTGANFGCGSSREQAPWALSDLGLRCLIAPSFGEIFYANCLNNGILPIKLEASEHAQVMAVAEVGQSLTVNLQTCSITLPDGQTIGFSIAERARQALLEGRDEIGAICQLQERITAFEHQQKQLQPWLYAA